MRYRVNHFIGISAIALAAAAMSGCAATVRTRGELVYGYPTVRAEVVPVEIATYPRVYYRGAYAYLVGGRWYYPTARGWVVFREEPVELARYRVSYAQQIHTRRRVPAPPANEVPPPPPPERVP